eukprot:CAMPEP_0173365510 /NCGR_PEP_ID=MMETSP1144-20121109/23663_1 /TAXON_ID=483371 /ORGANISM="non described non described, Strain CCMP2298" /LENGTH=155 /DNA_ID=CAMNT_0014315943 /DNA_START=90 /DNA_END=554 /DNA_ORIENTATION=-
MQRLALLLLLLGGECMCFRSFPSLHGTKYRTGTGLRSPLFPLSPLFSTDPSDFGEEPAPSTVDIYGDGDDMEVLETMRIARQVANDRWQSCVFRDDQGGFWSGSYEVFKPRVTDGGLSLAKVESGSTSCDITAGIYSAAGVNITMVESFSPTFTL